MSSMVLLKDDVLLTDGTKGKREQVVSVPFFVGKQMVAAGDAYYLSDKTEYEQRQQRQHQQVHPSYQPTQVSHHPVTQQTPVVQQQANEPTEVKHEQQRGKK